MWRGLWGVVLHEPDRGLAEGGPVRLTVFRGFSLRLAPLLSVAFEPGVFAFAPSLTVWSVADGVEGCSADRVGVGVITVEVELGRSRRGGGVRHFQQYVEWAMNNTRRANSGAGGSVSLRACGWNSDSDFVRVDAHSSGGSCGLRSILRIPAYSSAFSRSE